MQLTGYIPFGKPTEFQYDPKGNYRILFEPGCMEGADISECILVVAHNDRGHNRLSQVPELLIKVSPIGIIYEAEVTENIVTRALHYDIQRGYVKGSSFKFEYNSYEQQWSTIDGDKVLIIKRIFKVIDIGPCMNPANLHSWVRSELSIRQSILNNQSI